MAAAPASAAAVGGGGATQLVPVAGQNFVPASQGVPGAAPGSSAPQPAGAAGAPQAGAPAQAATAGAAQQQGIDAQQGLAVLKEHFGEQYGDPIVAADGRVYMELRKPSVQDGKLVLNFALVAKIDTATGRMVVNPDFLSSQQAKRDPNAKLVKVEDRYFWQTMAQGPDGKLTAQMEPVSEAELQRLNEEAQQQEAQQQLQQWNQDKVEWMRKLGALSGTMKTIGYTGAMLDGMAQGPNPYTGKVNAHWMSGYMVLQMLDAQAEGKLLPQWMKSGPIGTAIDWAFQGIFMMDMGRDIDVLTKAFPRAGAAYTAFTAPTRSVIGGVRALASGALKAGTPAAAAATGAGQAAGAGATASAAAAQQASQAAEMTSALGELGKGINAGTIKLVGAHPDLAGQAAVMTEQGLQLVPEAAVFEAMKQSQAPLTGAMKAQSAITSGIHGAIGALRPAFNALKIGGSVFGTVAGAMNIALTVKNQGAKSLITTRDGRGALFGFLGSGAFLGLMLLGQGMIPYTPVIASGLSLASNVFSGISMLNYAGLFGEGGFLDHDAVRAAFLIPPLTPLGLAGLWMKRREKALKAEQAQLQQNQEQAVQSVTQLRQQAAQQLAAGGAIQGAVTQPDGSIALPTGISNDLSAGPSGSATVPEGTKRMLRLISRPMR